jgi:hypothetical protein
VAASRSVNVVVSRVLGLALIPRRLFHAHMPLRRVRYCMMTDAGGVSMRECPTLLQLAPGRRRRDSACTTGDCARAPR